MSEVEPKILKLSEADLRLLLDVCARELLMGLYRHTVNPELVNIIDKITEILAPKPPDNGKDKIPG